MEREEFIEMLVEQAGWSIDDATQEADSIYGSPEPGDRQDVDGDMFY